MKTLKVACAQINVTLGDLDGNARRILETMEWAQGAGADVLLLPELAVTGYPPEDLVLRESFVAANLEVLDKLAAASGRTTVVVGFVDRAAPDERPDDSAERAVANAAALLSDGQIQGVYHKVLLPNFGVFDEDRYFVPGRRPAQVWQASGVEVGVSICEDIWSPAGPPNAQADAGAEILLNINGSPYHLGKGMERTRLLADQARRSGVPVVYLNLVGGQDELVFDGESMVFDAAGTLLHRAAQFEEDLFIVDVPLGPAEGVHAASSAGIVERPGLRPRLDDEAEVYAALVSGLRDYVHKNGFRGVVIGLSGGIDSALTATIAVDALGPDAVWGVTMPSRYSSEGSVDDSRVLAEHLGIRFAEVPIEGVFGAYLEALGPLFAGTEPNVAEENLQARIRGAMLMALSNKFGGMVVATGNKSEMAVGYATLYGDMAGGYAVLKDVFKTMVYRLARWRNRSGVVIPETTIEKPPSAELRPDQKDTDSLPDYDLLDEILRRYVELDQSAEEIVAYGLPVDVVRRVAELVDRNEYKRRQAAPGVKITRKAFGRDRRLPITNRFRR